MHDLPRAARRRPVSRPWRVTGTLLIALAASPADADDGASAEASLRALMAANPAVTRTVVEDYVVRNPAVLQDALADILRTRQPTPQPAPDTGQAVAANAAALFGSLHQVTLGNPQGAVTLVEFFDYNCGYCKRALGDTLALLDSDKDLRIVLKELPILGPGSLEAARVAVAARMQDTDGAKLLTFHKLLLGRRGPANLAAALEAARAAGFDADRIATDIDSDEVRATLAESAFLARSLAINGTPGYVVGSTVVPGAVGLDALRSRIALARR